jgi:hypothetical protein
MTTDNAQASADEATDVIRGWVNGRLPAEWFEASPTVVVDREEITIIGVLPLPTMDPKVSPAERAGTVQGAVAAFRAQTRDERIAMARDLEHRTNRKVAWGVEIDGEQYLFTHLATPVMTRLRQPQRQVLDTLVGAGVARSRADALAWCVRLVGQHADDWLAQLREAMADVERVRAEGPDL